MLKETKEIYDPIHGYIKITSLAQKIIHTTYFQRLRYLHQLGTCHYVFPCATHTRFEHSIGTYYLAGKVLDTLKKNSSDLSSYLLEIKELSHYFQKNPVTLDPYICELVKIAALCHDLGHGPFSHVFDDIFMKEKSKNHPLEHHENRSCAILRHIISKNEELSKFIHSDEITFICNLINPKEEHQGFIYQIVSNNLNSIDVDKFDYIQRDTYTLGLKYSIDSDRLISDMKVIDNKICFTLKVYYDTVSIFTTRYRLHKQIYSHKTVISTQYMIKDIMMILDKFVDIYSTIFDIDKFTDLTEEYLVTHLKMLHSKPNNYSELGKKEISDAYNIWINLNERKLYELVISQVTNHHIDISTIQDKYNDKIVCYQTKIGYVSGQKTNPLHDVYFYNHKDNGDKCFKITKSDSSFLVPEVYQEYITMIFVKDKQDKELKTELSKFFYSTIC